MEDLLTAALNLSIENAYLDVHYRSRNSDLIAFSNQQFWLYAVKPDACVLGRDGHVR